MFAALRCNVSTRQLFCEHVERGCAGTLLPSAVSRASTSGGCHCSLRERQSEFSSDLQHHDKEEWLI